VEVKTSIEILNKIASNLAIHTPVKTVERGSLLHSIIASVSSELEKNYYAISEVFGNSFLSSANGVYLDAIGGLFGTSRLEEQLLQSTEGIRFYTNDGKALNRYVDNNFFKNVGIFSNSNMGTMKVVSNVTQSQLNNGFVDVVCEFENKGDSYFAVDTITRFTPAVTGISVTNVIPINLKFEREDDVSFRQRIKNSLAGSKFGTLPALTLKSIASAGVSEVFIKEMEKGAGTISMYIVPQDLSLRNAIAYEVSKKVSGSVPAGMILEVKPIDLIYVKTKMKVMIKQNEDAEIKRIEVLNRLRQYINNLQRGVSLSLGSVINLMKIYYPEHEVEVLSLEFEKEDKYGIRYQIGKKDRFDLLETEKFSTNPLQPIIFSQV
jgi:uncharacterized phage protein gp47/JayE